MRQLIKIPGLHDRAELFRLKEEQYEDLQAIESYINWAHNVGHSDITTRIRGSFDHFFENVYDTHAVAAPVSDHTISLIQALKSPKITAQMARQLHHTDIRRILAERDIPPHMTTVTYAATRERGGGTNAQPTTHDTTRDVNVTVSSPFRPEIPHNHAEALELDWENDNSKWVDSVNLELSHLKALEITTTLSQRFKLGRRFPRNSPGIP